MYEAKDTELMHKIKNVVDVDVHVCREFSKDCPPKRKKVKSLVLDVVVIHRECIKCDSFVTPMPIKY